MSRELTDAEVKVLTELSYKKSIKKGNKINKDLEALEIWKKIKGDFNSEIGDDEDIICIHLSRKDYRSIENALKRLEKPKKIVGTTTVSEATKKAMLELCPDVVKQLEALEIVKKCNAYIDLYYIEETNEYRFLGEEITKEEFDLVKEVLL